MEENGEQEASFSSSIFGSPTILSPIGLDFSSDESPKCPNIKLCSTKIEENNEVNNACEFVENIPLLLQPVVTSVKALQPRKGGRKPKILSEEEKKLRKKRKEEINRDCAKRYRKNKKDYIGKLEQTVENLQNELSICKARLAEYEKKYSVTNSFELYQKMLGDFRKFQLENLCSMLDSSKSYGSLQEISKKYEDVSDLRQEGLKILSQALMEAYLPLPIKFVLEAYNWKSHFFDLARAGEEFTTSEFHKFIEIVHPTFKKALKNDIIGEYFFSSCNISLKNIHNLFTFLEPFLESSRMMDISVQSRVFPFITIPQFIAMLDSLNMSLSSIRIPYQIPGHNSLDSTMKRIIEPLCYLKEED